MTKVLIATYSQSGRTQEVADQLANLISDANQYQITVADDTFSNDMYETDAIATKQIQTGNFPELVNAIPNVKDYDLILVGSPVWRGAPATPVHTFLERLQGYQGKVATFYTDAGSAGDYEKNFKKWAGNLDVVSTHEGSHNIKHWVEQIL
jgi:flavodoxin